MKRHSSNLIRSKICHDIRTDPAVDPLNGDWHAGYRLPDSETVAFYYKRQWWASTSASKVQGPFSSREEVLKIPYDQSKPLRMVEIA